VKYGSLKNKWSKENGIETIEIESHVAASYHRGKQHISNKYFFS
jgi:hypothetical protein